jgi:gas vesicle protein
VIVTVLMIAYQEFESRILVPRVYGKVLRLPPAVVLVSLLVGGTLMGIIGALLALPIAAGLLMVARELRVELPGENPADASTRARDQKAEDIYEQLTEGATAADAGVIADELAQRLKRRERTGAVMTAEIPAIMADIADEKAEIADEKAEIADEKAEIADEKAEIADEKARLAEGTAGRGLPRAAAERDGGAKPLPRAPASDKDAP